MSKQQAYEQGIRYSDTLTEKEYQAIINYLTDNFGKIIAYQFVKGYYN